jgi:hypothetical protein
VLFILHLSPPVVCPSNFRRPVSFFVRDHVSRWGSTKLAFPAAGPHLSVVVGLLFNFPLRVRCIGRSTCLRTAPVSDLASCLGTRSTPPVLIPVAQSSAWFLALHYARASFPSLKIFIFAASSVTWCRPSPPAIFNSHLKVAPLLFGLCAADCETGLKDLFLCVKIVGRCRSSRAALIWLIFGHV